MKTLTSHTKVKCSRVMVTLSFLFCGQNVVFAQQNEVPAQNGVMINSNPPAVMITLKGEYEFVGRTPYLLPYPLLGQYRIKATKSGYESKVTDHIFSPSNGDIYEITLSRKSRGKAAYRSLLFPGWGHFYANRKTWGAFYSCIVATSVGAATLNQLRYYDKQAAHKDAYIRFNNTEATFEEQNKAFQDMVRLSQEMKNHTKQRDRSLYIAGGMWLFSIVENLIFFPSSSHETGSMLQYLPSFSPVSEGATLQMRIPIK